MQPAMNITAMKFYDYLI